MIATHDVEQARGWDRVLCLNRRQIAFGPPARRSRGGAGGDARRRDRELREDGAARPARCFPPHHPRARVSMAIEVSAGDVWHAVADPWRRRSCSVRFAEVVLLGLVGGALGCWIVFYGLSYSAESLAHGLFPGLVLSALTGIPLLVGGARGLVVAALAIALAGRVPRIGRDTAVAIVITLLFGLGALLALSPDLSAGHPGPAVRRRPRGVRQGPGCSPAAPRRRHRGALLLARQLLVVGFDRRVARRRSAAGRCSSTRPCCSCWRLRSWSRCRDSGTCSCSPSWWRRRPRPRLLVHADRPDDGGCVALAVAGGIGGLYLSYYAGTAAGASIAAVTVVLYALVSMGAWAVRASRRMRGTGPAAGGREPGYARTR